MRLSMSYRIHVNLLRKWVEDFERDVKQVFPGRGKLRADDAEIARLKRELADAKAVRDSCQGGSH